MRRTTGILLGPGNDEMRGRKPKRRREFAVSRKWTPLVSRKSPAKSSFWEILIKYLKLYCKHTCLAGINYREFKRASKLSRFLWFCGYTYIYYLAISYVYDVYKDYLNPSISITEKYRNLFNMEFQFTGTAVCPINKISRRAGMELATKMFEANISNLTLRDIYKTILSMGDLYQSQFLPEHDYSLVVELLSKFYNDNYDITDILEMLAPQCSAMFLACYFDGEEKNCSNIFRLSKTRNGFCCTFNYIAAEEDKVKSESNRDPAEIFITKNSGLDFGLMVSMDPFLEDYGYISLPTSGWKVMVFDPFNYPDQSCGSVSEFLVSPLSWENIELFQINLLSNEVIRSYPIKKRGCVFQDEKKGFHRMYSFNKCIVRCRIDDIWNSCKCRPFYYPSFGHTESSRRTCGVRDIPCLREYNKRKQSIIPYEDETVMSVISDEERVLMCNNCYPECDDSNHFTDSSSAVLRPGYYDIQLLPKINVTNHSVLHVYYSNQVHIFLKQDESYRWYEHLSDAGGIFSFFLGFSIVSVVELLYFLVQFLLEVFGFYTLKTEKEHSDKKIAIRSVYWNEYFPQPRIDTRIYCEDDDRF